MTIYFFLDFAFLLSPMATIQEDPPVFSLGRLRLQTVFFGTFPCFVYHTGSLSRFRDPANNYSLTRCAGVAGPVSHSFLSFVGLLPLFKSRYPPDVSCGKRLGRFPLRALPRPNDVLCSRGFFFLLCLW